MARRGIKYTIAAEDRSAAAFRSVGASLSRLERQTVNLRGVFAGLLGLFAGRALVNFTRDALSAADAVAKTADRLGVTTDALQELRFAAQLAGVEQRTLDLAMQRFTRRTAEAAAGTGTALAAFEEMGVALRNSRGEARSIDAVLGDVADALRDTEAQGDRVRLAFKLFDSEGVKVVNMLQAGSTALDATRQRARELGIVIDERLLRSAEGANDAFAIMGRVLSSAAAATVLELAPALTTLTERLVDMLPAIRAVAEFFVNLGRSTPANELAALERKIAGVDRALADTARDAAAAVDKINDFRTVLGDDLSPSTRDDMAARLAEAQGERTDILERQIALHRQRNALLAEAAEIRAELARQDELLRRPAPPAPPAGAGVPAVAAGARFAGAMPLAKPLAATAAATEAATAASNARTVALVRERSAQDDLTRAIDHGALDAIERLAAGYGSWRDAAVSALGDVTRATLDYLRATSGGGSGSIFGSLVKLAVGAFAGGFAGPASAADMAQPNAMGGRAGGGGVSAGGLYQVNEMTTAPGLFMPLRSGAVFPAREPAPAGGGAGTVINADLRGADVAAVQRLEAFVAQLNGSIEARAVGAVADAQVRTRFLDRTA